MKHKTRPAKQNSLFDALTEDMPQEIVIESPGEGLSVAVDDSCILPDGEKIRTAIVELYLGDDLISIEIHEPTKMAYIQSLPNGETRDIVSDTIGMITVFRNGKEPFVQYIAQHADNKSSHLDLGLSLTTAQNSPYFEVKAK